MNDIIISFLLFGVMFILGVIAGNLTAKRSYYDQFVEAKKELADCKSNANYAYTKLKNVSGYDNFEEVAVSEATEALKAIIK
jgi:hypothetical protein